MLAVVVFDTVAALASRRLGFSYGWASPGSFVIYAAIGFLAARSGSSMQGAALAAGYVGLFDMVVGLRIGLLIEPPGIPEEISRGEWILAGVMAILTAAGCGALGALAA
jgi:hypothetical protein